MFMNTYQGFQSTSNKITRLAATRFTPRDPACIQKDEDEAKDQRAAESHDRDSFSKGVPWRISKIRPEMHFH